MVGADDALLVLVMGTALSVVFIAVNRRRVGR